MTTSDETVASSLPERPEELISASIFVSELRRRLGAHHPFYAHLKFEILFTRDSLPSNLRQLVHEGWIGQTDFHLRVLARLARSEELLPVCWILADRVSDLYCATMETFMLPDEKMRQEFGLIRDSWNDLYPKLEATGSACAAEPPGLGEDWYELLSWRDPNECEETFWGDEPQCDCKWEPFYRFSDLRKALAILTGDARTGSAFGHVPVRQLRDLASSVISKYGLQTRRPGTPQKPLDARTVRVRILSSLIRQGWTRRKIQKAFVRWITLPSEIQRAIAHSRDQNAREAALSALSESAEVPVDVIRAVRALNKSTRRAANNGQALFNCSSRTFSRAWKEAQGLLKPLDL